MSSASGIIIDDNRRQCQAHSEKPTGYERISNPRGTDTSSTSADYIQHSFQHGIAVREIVVGAERHGNLRGDP